MQFGGGESGKGTQTPFNLPLPPGFWWHLSGIFASTWLKYEPHTFIGTPMHYTTVWYYKALWCSKLALSRDWVLPEMPLRNPGAPA